VGLREIRDATERRATECARRITEQLADVAKVEAAEALAASERRFRNAFEQNMAPMIFTDLEDRVTTANEAFCKLLGRTKDELLGNDMTPFTHPEDLAITEESHRRLTSGEIEQALYVKRYLHKDGLTIFVEVSKSPARDATGKVLYYTNSIRDITDRRRRDHDLELLTEVNRLATSASSGTAFLQGLCDVVVEQCGYKLAWIGVPSSHVEGDVEITYATGATDYLYAGMLSWRGSKESGLRTAGTALRTGVTQVVSELATAANFELWRERSSRFGFGSSVAVTSDPRERPS
jgi:PAS domain S-box-containing protein